MGFNDETLTRIATYCFRRGVRTLEGMNDVVDKFYKQGVVTSEALDEFINRSIENDNHIKKVFAVAGIDRNVTARDRDSFKVWKTAWNMSDELIEKAAEKAKGSPSPVSYMNTLLSSWFKAGVKTPNRRTITAFPTIRNPPKSPKHIRADSLTRCLTISITRTFNELQSGDKLNTAAAALSSCAPKTRT